jgi:oxygen-independent coproporphyrinogen-3 oxidase
LSEARAWLEGPPLEDIDLRGAKVATVYIGGGSPTFLGPQELERLLVGLRHTLPTTPDVEWTLESHPQELSPEIVQVAKGAGVSRLSIGVQSFDAQGLEVIGRRHPAAGSFAELKRLVSGWHGGLSVDFIGERPGQTAGGLAEDLRLSLQLGADHVSVYPLSWPSEPRRCADPRDRLGYPDFDAWEIAEGILPAEGFRRYEVSNFAKPGSECRHSLAYWRLQPYLGIGPGAVGTLPLPDRSRRSHRWTIRCAGITPLSAYLASPERPAVAVERQSKRVAFFERIMMGLRLSDGLELVPLRAEFGDELPALLEEATAEHRGSHLEANEERLWCTPAGRRNLDAILRDLTEIMD